jgi:hypothetical protein
MAWVKQSDRLWSDAKFCAMSDGAQALWHRANSYLADQLLDGELPESALKFLSTRKRYVEELEREGYWVRRPSGGWLAASWQEIIQSKAQVLARRSETNQRVRAHRNAVTNGVSNTSPGPGPVPVREEAVASSLSPTPALSQNVTPFPRPAVSAAEKIGRAWYGSLVEKLDTELPSASAAYDFIGKQSAEERELVAANLRASSVHGSRKALRALSPQRIADKLWHSHLLSEADHAEQKSKYGKQTQPAAAPVPAAHKLMQF